MRRNDARSAFLPIVILPALMPAMMLPLVRALHPPDYVAGLAMGVPIGFSLVGIAWMAKGARSRRRSGPRRAGHGETSPRMTPDE